MKFYQVYITILFSFLLLNSCKDPDDKEIIKPKPSNPEELITSFKMTLTDAQNPSIKAEFSFKDLDGPGGADPVSNTLILTKNKTYTGKIELLDESQNPAVNISDEVRNEGNSHRLFYEVQDIQNILTIEAADLDNNDPKLPVGLEIKVIVKDATGEGKIKCFLSHYPGKKTDAPSTETDLEVIVPVRLE